MKKRWLLALAALALVTLLVWALWPAARLGVPGLARTSRVPEWHIQ